MARGNRKTASQFVGREAAPIVRATPDVCPVCGAPMGGQIEELTTHLQGHAPRQRCTHCGEQHQGWKLDWDAVRYPRSGVGCFYCDPCGFHVPAPQSAAD